MPYDRDSRYDRDDFAQPNDGEYSRPYGSGRENTYSSARDYQSSGRMSGGRDRDEYGRGGGYGHDRSEYGARDYGNQRYEQRERFGREQGGYGQSAQSSSRYGQGGGYQPEGRGGNDRDMVRGRDYGRQSQGHQSQGHQSPGYNHDERGFLDRAGDEVRSWFGDEEAERRRDMDQRYDERSGHTGRARHDDDYHNWRQGQISSLDRDYDEYRRENRSKFEREFSEWRSNRQTQRQSLSKVAEHQEVVGSDGQHVGTVDKVRGDRIILTKTDKDAGGQHHSVPCSWITSVDDKVMLNKSAAEAKRAWHEEAQSQAMIGGSEGKDRGGDFSGGGNLNRSFSGTY